jgi:hypothetical protein
MKPATRLTTCVFTPYYLFMNTLLYLMTFRSRILQP